MKYPKTRPTPPIMSPTFSISFCWIMPVACAKAFGGVEIGRTIARDEPKATPISSVATPPSGNRLSLILIPAIASIGTSKAAVAVCEMKLAIIADKS